MKKSLRCAILLSALSLWMSSGWAENRVPGSFVGVTYNGLHATAQPTENTIKADLNSIAGSFGYVRTYYPQYTGFINLLGLTSEKNLNLKVLAGFYLFYNEGHYDDWARDNYRDFFLPALKNNPNIIGALVSNEDPESPVDQIPKVITYLKKVRADAPAIPLSTAQTNAFWLHSPYAAEVAGLVDFIAVNIYPTWCWGKPDDVVKYTTADRLPPVYQPPSTCTPGAAPTPQQAVVSFKTQFAQMQSTYPGRQIVVTETGYPTNYGAPPVPADTVLARTNACQYMKLVSEWAKENDKIVFMYEMFDSQEGISKEIGFNYHFGLSGKGFTIPLNNIPAVSCDLK